MFAGRFAPPGFGAKHCSLEIYSRNNHITVPSFILSGARNGMYITI